MKHNKTIIRFIFLIILSLLVSCNSTKLQHLKHNQTISLTGTINLVGNIPFTHYALNVQKHHYNLDLKTKDEVISTTIENNLGKHVTIKGNINIYEIKSADLKYSIKKYELIATHITLHN
tara:strand:- start:5373 stop:5732 length:360 start_codon:yes stop_codon:yes gene_type:complete